MPKFSADNYGDVTVKVTKPDGARMNSKKATRIRRATVFARTLRTLSDDQWNNIFISAREYFVKTNKVTKPRVRATSAATLVEEEEEDPDADFVMVLG
jgi:hypothetical protein